MEFGFYGSVEKVLSGTLPEKSPEWAQLESLLPVNPPLDGGYLLSTACFIIVPVKYIRNTVMARKPKVP